MMDVFRLSDVLSTTVKRVIHAISRPSVIAVFVLVGFWNISVSSDWLGPSHPGEGIVKETLRGLRDVNLRIQMRFYQALTSHRGIPFTTTDVTIAYIDNQTFWDTYHGQEPLDRYFLASVVQNLVQDAQTRPRAIGLDVSLFSPRNIPQVSTDSIRDFDTNLPSDEALLSAIHHATMAGTPIILASADYPDQSNRGQLTEIPNIFTPPLLAPQAGCGNTRCPAFGYSELPDDQREIPLTESVSLLDSPVMKTQNSFALAVAEAVNNPSGANKPSILSSISTRYTFGTFASEDTFTKFGVSALALAQGDPEAIRSCSGQVVLIGGHWRSMEGYGRTVDQHPSPVGTLSGLALNANYIESLLSPSYRTSEISGLVSIGLDVLVGLAIFGGFELARESAPFKYSILFVALVLPVISAYLAITTVHKYLDFVLPVELYFFHIFYEVLKPLFPQKAVTLTSDRATLARDR